MTDKPKTMREWEKEFNEKFVRKFQTIGGCSECYGQDSEPVIEFIRNLLVEQLKEVDREIIGDDENFSPFEAGGIKQHQNILKHKQRQLLKKLKESK